MTLATLPAATDPAQGASVSWADFALRNLLPVTLGNTLAGALCMGATYAFCFGMPGKTLSSGGSSSNSSTKSAAA